MTEKRTPTTSKPRDGRKLERRAMEHIRLRAVDQVIDGGERVVDVARSLGFDRTVVARWVIKANKHGRQSLLATVAPGAPSKLDDEQIQLLRFVIVEIEPNFFGFQAALWTRAMVAALIDKVFGVQLSVESVGRIMRDRMGLSAQRPVRLPDSWRSRRAPASSAVSRRTTPSKRKKST